MTANKNEQPYYSELDKGTDCPRPLDPDRLLNPFCPYCGEQTIPFDLQHDDGSGWMIGWTCNCQVVRDMERNLPLGKIIKGATKTRYRRR